MVFTKEDKVSIKVFRQRKAYGMKMFVKELLNKTRYQSSLNKSLKKIDQSCCVGNIISLVN